MGRGVWHRLRRSCVSWLIGLLRSRCFGPWAERHLIRLGRDAVPELRAASLDAAPEVRFRAVYALGKIQDPGVMDILIDRALRDDDARVRYDAIVSIGYLGDPCGIPAVHALLEGFAQDSVEASACWVALSRLEPDEAESHDSESA